MFESIVKVPNVGSKATILDLCFAILMFSSFTHTIFSLHLLFYVAINHIFLLDFPMHFILVFYYAILDRDSIKIPEILFSRIYSSPQATVCPSNGT